MFDLMPPSTVFADRHVVTVQTDAAGHRKIFAVSFGQDDSVYVHLPYFYESDGLLIRIVGRQIDGRVFVERTELPHTTSRRVKFSYHPDGRAHFSQDRQVKTVVIGSLPPLVVHEGVLFQVQAYGLDRYKAVEAKDLRPSQKKALVDCTPNSEFRGVTITGYISKPGWCAVESTGEPRLLARSPRAPMLIALGYKELHVPTSYQGAHLLFSGGPSAPAIIAPGGARSVLMAVYPRGRATSLFPGAESADFVPPQTG